MKDDLGRRMKQDYEDALRLQVPRRSYVVIRIDGRGFHTFTKHLERPYSRLLADALDQAALSLCQEMIGCRFAYGQSDEYSFLLSDFEKDNAPLWFDGNVQKIVSVSASLFTAYFNQAFSKREDSGVRCAGAGDFTARRGGEVFSVATTGCLGK